MFDSITKIILLGILGSTVSLLEWLLYRRFLFSLKKRRKKTWQTAFLKAVHHPLQIYIWSSIVSLSLFFALTILFPFNSKFENITTSIYLVLTIIFVFWFAMRFTHQLENALLNRARKKTGRTMDETTVHAMAQTARVILIIVVSLMFLETMGVRISGLLAFSGIGVAVIGFTAKDTLGNLFGGMMIYWDRPFSVGDWIRSTDRPIEGIVERIGWRLTRIRTFDKRSLYVPNALFSNISLENASRMTHRRLNITVRLRYSDVHKITDITKAIEEMLRLHRDIDSSQTLFVKLVEFSLSSLDILVYAFTRIKERMQFQSVQQEIMLKIMDIISHHNAKCAFDTKTINIADELLHLELKEKNDADRKYISKKSNHEE